MIVQRDTVMGPELVVTEFQDDYRFLSNFYPAPITYMGRLWPSVEHAYQACKTANFEQQELIRLATAGQAKRLGRKVDQVDDWGKIKVGIMYHLLALKFTTHQDLRQKLVDTGDMVLEEGNTWKDTFWGICPPNSGIGENNLGRLLMQIRKLVR